MQAHDFAVPHELLLENCPGFVILNIGGNDLAQGTSPLAVASAVVQLGERLVRDYAARDVIICHTADKAFARHHPGPVHQKYCSVQQMPAPFFAMLTPLCIIISYSSGILE